MPARNISAADSLKSEATGNYAAYIEAITNAYQVASGSSPRTLPSVARIPRHYPHRKAIKVFVSELLKP
jgi:hypothetical protein